MPFRYICFNAEDFTFYGTDDESEARAFALDHHAVDVQTGRVLDADRLGNDADLQALPGA
jgi:hypothetical protein